MNTIRLIAPILGMLATCMVVALLGFWPFRAGNRPSRPLPFHTGGRR